MQLLHGDCLEVMRQLEANSVDTIITDPPYGYTFMGKNWDHGVPGVPFWLEALRVAKPGAFLLAFGGSRTYHRLTCAIEDAGWEIRDCIMWIYASGFNKVGLWKNQPSFIERGLADKWDGWGGALKPAFEPIVVAMKPLESTFAANAEKHGVAGLWIDGGRIELEGIEHHRTPAKSGLGKNGIYGKSTTDELTEGRDLVRYTSKGRWPANVIFDEASGALLDAMSGERTSGWRDSDKSGPATLQASKVVGGPHYGDTGGASRFFFCAKASRSERNAGLEGMPERESHQNYGTIRTNRGNGYEKSNKLQNHHPTVKPLALMEYLCKLTRTPAGGVVLDPFMGSGSTGVACVMTDRDFIGIEQDAEYLEIARARIEAEQAKPKQLGLAI